ncbi:hypothetical protein ACTG9Q_19465 [Actinokineospora sp. 24-640]
MSLVAALVYLAAGALSSPTLRYSSDSYQYSVTALYYLGVDPRAAHTRAVGAHCSAAAQGAERARQRNPVKLREPAPTGAEARCADTYRDAMIPIGARYQAIFSPRVGYPLLAAPLVAVLGVPWGMWLAAALCTAAAGALVWLLLRRMGVSPGWAVVGQVLLYVSPIGVWGSWALAEGVVFAGAVGALLGAWMLVDRGGGHGLAVLMAGLGVASASKYSTGMMLAAALAGAGLLLLAWPRYRHRGVRALALVSGGCAVAVHAASVWRGWSGTTDTLQDKWTDHFRLPDVHDPWERLWEMNGIFWEQWAGAHLAAPMLLVAVAAGVWGLARYSPAGLVVVGAVAATGVVTQVMHPIAAQGDRLIAPLWLVVAVGIPLLMATTRSLSTQPPATHALGRGDADRREELHVVTANGREATW